MSIRVLLIDDHRMAREGLAAVLGREPDLVVVEHASDIRTAIELAWEVGPDVVVLETGGSESIGLQRIQMLCAQISDVPVLALSLLSEWSRVLLLLGAGASGYVLKDRAFEELALAIRTLAQGGLFVSPGITRSESLLAAASAADGVASGPSAETVCRLIEMRNTLIGRHQRRVSELATAIAVAMGLPPDEVEEIRQAALMHDIGKTTLPDEMLSSAKSLAWDELESMRRHAEAGHVVLLSGGISQPVAELVHQHHERCDGSGYPRGLAGEQILLGARVLAVADVVEAMISRRPYRLPHTVHQVLDELASGAGEFYDNRAVAACLQIFRDGFAFASPE